MAMWTTINPDGTVTIEDAGTFDPTMHRQYAAVPKDDKKHTLSGGSHVRKKHKEQRPTRDATIGLKSSFDVDAYLTFCKSSSKKRKKSSTVHACGKTYGRVQACFRPHKINKSK